MNLLRNQQAAETIDSVFIDLEAQLMQNIARHLQDWKKPIDTDKWLMQKLAEIGKLNQENIKIIAQMSGLSQTTAERMLSELAEETINSMEPGFRYLVNRGLADNAVDVGKSKNVKQTMKTLQKQAKDTINLTNTTMLYKAQEAFKSLVQNTSQEALRIMNSNTTAVITGAESRQQALRRTIRQFNEKGITGFVDKRGREWTPEAYVNMAMRTTAGSVANEMQTARCLDYGINLISIDSHSGARPKCAKDQGKIFDLNNGSGTTEDLNGRKIKYYPWSSSSYGEPDGLLGINCGHHKYPFVPGVNIQRYFPTEDLDANNKLYKETQVQRALERDVRKQKRECMLYDTIGDKDAFEEAAVKLKAKEAQLKNYVDTHQGLHRRKNREQVVGFDKRISANAIFANKTYTKAMNTDTISIKDIYIVKSLSARGRNYDVLDPETGEYFRFVGGTKIQNAEVFAGKGTKHPLHPGVAEGLSEQIGGSPTKWQHCKGNGIIDYYGEERAAEVHWFQEETVGKVKFKVKRWKDED